MKLNFEVFEMQKRNVPTDIIQIVEGKNGVTFLVTLFTQEDLSVALKCFSQAVTNCLLSSAERTKTAIFYVLITITLEVNLIFTVF